jgi:hypothetical protein
MGVIAEMVVMQATREAEIAEVCGPKGKHDPDGPRCAMAAGAARSPLGRGWRWTGHRRASSPGNGAVTTMNRDRRGTTVVPHSDGTRPSIS